MISYTNKKSLKDQITNNIKSLKRYRKAYKKKVELYNGYIDTLLSFEDDNAFKQELSCKELGDRLIIFNSQIDIIENSLKTLSYFYKDYVKKGKTTIEKEELRKYNQEYKKIRNTYINSSFLEDDITKKYINCLVNDFAITYEKMKEKNETEEEKVFGLDEKKTISNSDTLKNNDTLLISEIEEKVILPYTAEEVQEIFENNRDRYETVEDVIEKKFTRNLSDYKVQFKSRYNETMKLVRERENYGLTESIALATEMMNKKFLHPAIISACRSLNELDVYLDCLDKNELDQFKIFKIKYELHPAVVKNKKHIV